MAIIWRILKKLEDYKTSEVRFCNLSRVKRLFSFQNLFFSPPPVNLDFHITSEFSQNHTKIEFFSKIRAFLVEKGLRYLKTTKI